MVMVTVLVYTIYSSPLIECDVLRVGMMRDSSQYVEATLGLQWGYSGAKAMCIDVGLMMFWCDLIGGSVRGSRN